MDWKKFFSYYKPYVKGFLADLFFACMGAAVTLIIPLLVRYITGTVVYEEPGEALRTIMELAAVMLALVLVEGYCNYFISYYGHVMSCKIERDMRREIFEHYQKLSFAYYDNQKVGHLMSRVTNDLFDISELLHHGPEDIVISVIKIVGSLTILAVINWKLALVAFILLPVMFCYALYFFKKMRKAYKQNRARIADINAQIEDSLSGIRVVKSFGNEDVEMEKFNRGNERFLSSKSYAYRYMGLYNSGLGAFITLITIAVLVAGAVMLTQGGIVAADLVTFLLYVNNFTEPVKKLVTFTEQFQNGMSGYDRFREVMEVKPDIADRKGAAEAGKLSGNVSFRNVSFHYEDGQPDVFEGLNLEVKAGEYVALVGPSGVGKTTLCSLIPRFYEVSEGQVLIDGTDVRDFTLKSLRSQIGIVQQDVYLFAGTVADNIRYGKPDASEEEIRKAAMAANAHEFITALPEGYDTDIGQRGVKLSGGQKQRISLARVFLKDPAVLIFDEATSALDNESERVVQESMERLAKNRTTFVIAHRLSTIRHAERILVLTEEGIAEEGTHEQLLLKKGLYEKLYEMQFA